MLLGDADVEETVREAAGEGVEAGAFGHGRGDGDDALVAFGQAHQRLAERLRVGRPYRAALLAPLPMWNGPVP